MLDRASFAISDRWMAQAVNVKPKASAQNTLIRTVSPSDCPLAVSDNLYGRARVLTILQKV